MAGNNEFDKGYGKDFDELDVDKSGLVNVKEFKQVVSNRVLGLSDYQLETYFEEYDADGDKNMTRAEYIRGGLHWEPLDEEVIKKLFKMHEKDHVGYLTVEQLTEAMKIYYSDYNEEKRKEKMESLCEDGKITEENFIKALRF